MSAIHVKTLLSVMSSGPRTLEQLSAETEYPIGKVIQYIWEARSEGFSIMAIAAPPLSGLPTGYEYRPKERDAE